MELLRRWIPQENNHNRLDRTFWHVVCLLIMLQGIGILSNVDVGVQNFVPAITHGVVSPHVYGLLFFGGACYALGLGGHRSTTARTIILSLILVHVLGYISIFAGDPESYSASPITLYALTGVALIYISARIPVND